MQLNSQVSVVAGRKYVLRASRSLRGGGEILLNYGAKGNGELLRDHGFVLAKNEADVHEVCLERLNPTGLAASDLAARHSALRRMRLPLRHFLFRGALPPELLRDHGFVLAKNEADVHEVCLQRLNPTCTCACNQ